MCCQRQDSPTGICWVYYWAAWSCLVFPVVEQLWVGSSVPGALVFSPGRFGGPTSLGQWVRARRPGAKDSRKSQNFLNSLKATVLFTNFVSAHPGGRMVVSLWSVCPWFEQLFGVHAPVYKIWKSWQHSHSYEQKEKRWRCKPMGKNKRQQLEWIPVWISMWILF